MSYNVNVSNNISLEEIYHAFLAKEIDYAIDLYARLEGVNASSAKRWIETMYRVFHIGYNDCLAKLSVDDIPGFKNNTQSDVWRAGFDFALKLPAFKVSDVEEVE